MNEDGDFMTFHQFCNVYFKINFLEFYGIVKSINRYMKQVNVRKMINVNIHDIENTTNLCIKLLLACKKGSKNIILL